MVAASIEAEATAFVQAAVHAALAEMLVSSGPMRGPHDVPPGGGCEPHVPAQRLSAKALKLLGATAGEVWIKANTTERKAIVLVTPEPARKSCDDLVTVALSGSVQGPATSNWDVSALSPEQLLAQIGRVSTNTGNMVLPPFPQQTRSTVDRTILRRTSARRTSCGPLQEEMAELAEAEADAADAAEGSEAAGVTEAMAEAPMTGRAARAHWKMIRDDVRSARTYRKALKESSLGRKPEARSQTQWMRPKFKASSKSHRRAKTEGRNWFKDLKPWG